MKVSLAGELLLCGLGGGAGVLEAGGEALPRQPSPASSESRDPANVNTSKEGFSIKVSTIWLHKHETGCKNKAKELLLMTSIKAV